MHGKMQSTGEFRYFLGQVMVAVQEGKIDLNRANCIAKLASQVNSSFLAEVQAAKIRLITSAEAPTLGEQELGDNYKTGMIEGHVE